MIKAVIFDLDGTIANTISAIREGVNLTMEKYGYPQHTYDEILSFINNGARELIRRAMPEEYRRDEELVTRVLADYDALYGTVYLHTDCPYEGIPEAVCALRDMGMKIGVLSNKQDAFVKGLANQLLPADSFVAAQGVIHGKPTKPDPYLSHLVANAMGVSPAECVMVGDSDVDIRTAANAGMTHVGVSWGYRNEEFLRANGAKLIAHTPGELLKIIENL